MISGYAGKFLEVDLSYGIFKDVRFADKVLKDYVGGRGLATKILCDRLLTRWGELDPLGPDNILFLLPGPLTGFFPAAECAYQASRRRAMESWVRLLRVSSEWNSAAPGMTASL